MASTSLAYACVCVVTPFILDVRLVNAPVGVIQEEGRTGFLYLSSAVLALIFLARGSQPSLSLVRSPLAGHDFFFSE